MDYSGSASAPQTAEPNHYVASYPPEELNTEFKRKYPPDPFGEEMGPNARVWKVYKDEATPHDKALLDGWNKTLDILLIFAGLFSAIATAFVIESYKLLQPDYEEYIANAIYVTLSSRNGSGAFDQVFDLPRPSDFAPLGSFRWLNGLWFTSLVLSLVVAFLCILFKQWLEEYNRRVSAPSPSSRSWTRRRMFYFDGLTAWAVPVFIAVLPLLLHAALFLFLFGLGILLWTLNIATATWVVVVASSLLLFYSASLVLPFIRSESPSSTPFVNLLRPPLRAIAQRLLFYLSAVGMANGVIPFSWDFSGRTWRQCLLSLVSEFFRVVYQYPLFLFSRAVHNVLPRRLHMAAARVFWRLHAEFHSTTSRPAGPLSFSRELSPTQRDRVDGHALKWLVTSCPSAEVAIAAFQAVGTVPPWSSVANLLRTAEGIEETVKRSLKAIYPITPVDHPEYSTADVARDLRSALCLFGPDRTRVLVAYVAPYLFETPISSCIHYDLPFIWEAMAAGAQWQAPSRLVRKIEGCYAVQRNLPLRPHFLTSTALQLLNISGFPLGAWLRLCRLLPFSEIGPTGFVQLISRLLPYKGYEICPLQRFHEGRSCRIQCSYELLSDILNSQESLALTCADTSAGLDVILGFASANPDINHVWVSVERSQFLVLLGSPLFALHDLRSLGSGLQGVVMHLKDMAHCVQRSWGLPPWGDDWAAALHSIVSTAVRLQPQFISVAWDMTLKVPWTIVQMFNVDDPHAHMHMLATDATSRLPLALLKHGSESTWTKLLSLRPQTSQRYVLDRLANLLAASLCVAARVGLDVDDEFTTFIHSTHLIDRLFDLQLGSESGESTTATEQFVSLIRHCNEVRQNSNWLSELLDRALQERVDLALDPAIRKTVENVGEAAAELGRCSMCPTALEVQGSLLGSLRARLARLRISAGHPRETFEQNRAVWDPIRHSPDDDSERGEAPVM